MSVGNTICWADIPVVDLDRSIKFYSAVLGQTVTKESGHGYEFGLFPHKDNNVSGCLVAMPDRKPSDHGALVYFSVDGRLDAAIEAAKSGGGSIVQEKHPIGPYGFRVVIRDTEGNVVALHSTKE